MKRFDFIKEENRWFVVLPSWEGSKEDLEMVCGADTLLDIVSKGSETATLQVSENSYNNYRFKLTYKEDMAEGGTYSLQSKEHTFEVWLCKVLKFVYGYLPEELYCN
jgi:hypothetical protein